MLSTSHCRSWFLSTIVCYGLRKNCVYFLNTIISKYLNIRWQIDMLFKDRLEECLEGEKISDNSGYAFETWIVLALNSRGKFELCNYWNY